MKKLFNLTSCRRTEEEISVAEKAGYELNPVPWVPHIQPGQEGLQQTGEEFAKVLGKAVSENAAVLIGSNSRVSAALVYGLRGLKGYYWPEMVVFEGEEILTIPGASSLNH